MTSSEKRADTSQPILDVLAERWSPYVFDPRRVEDEKLAACLEAARWAPSSYNEQPWVFIVARRENEVEFNRMLSCLTEANQAWAKNAGVLMLTAISTTFSRNDKPNRVAEHDLGLAAGNLCVQATALGLVVHQMAGVDLTKVRTTYAIPSSHKPMTGIAIGYEGSPEDADEELAKRDRGGRQRKSLDEFVFEDDWGLAAKLG